MLRTGRSTDSLQFWVANELPLRPRPSIYTFRAGGQPQVSQSLTAQIQIQAYHLVGRPEPRRSAPRGVLPRSESSRRALGVAGEPDQRPRPRRQVVGRQKRSCVADHLGQRGGVGGQRRDPPGHRLQRRIAEALERRGRGDERRLAVEAVERGGIDLAEQLDPGLGLERAPDLARAGARRTGNQPPQREAAAACLAKRAQQPEVVLARMDRRDGEEVRRVPGPGPPPRAVSTPGGITRSSLRPRVREVVRRGGCACARRRRRRPRVACAGRRAASAACTAARSPAASAAGRGSRRRGR